MDNLSSRKLFLLVFVVSLLGLLALCVSIVRAGHRAENQVMAIVEDRLLSRLEESGISGLAVDLDQIDRALVPGRDHIAVALWQVRPNVRRLIRETEAGVGAAFETTAEKADIERRAYRVRRVDVRAASESWAIPMADVDLRFGVQIPSAEVRAAWTTVGIIGAAYAFAICLTFLLQVEHARRYRQGVLDINSVLDRHSTGEEGLRIEGPLAAPELRELGEHINAVLPKVDSLMDDLRFVAAHLAHELRTPFLKIRIGVDQLREADSEQSRNKFSRAINQHIDRANSQLDSVMQLFRLRADEVVELGQDVRLGEKLTDLVYDKEEALTAKNRTLRMEVDESVVVKGNEHLLNLMLENLLQNAVKYADADGTIKVALRSDGDDFTLTLENGGTLPTDADMTTRFSQAGDQGGKSGFGLGLSLVGAIAERHGFYFDLSQAPQSKLVRAVVKGSIGGTNADDI